jgi:hypothetical protein
MPTFTCVLKEDRAGMKKGTTIQVSTSLSSCDSHKIKEVLERQFGKKAAEANHQCYWEITRN